MVLCTLRLHIWITAQHLVSFLTTGKVMNVHVTQLNLKNMSLKKKRIDFKGPHQIMSSNFLRFYSKHVIMLLVQKNSLQMCIHYSPAAVDSVDFLKHM